MNEQTRQVRDAIDAALTAHDKAAAVRAATAALDDGRLGVDELYRDVLLPVLADVGARWQAGERHVWEEHLASAAVRTIVELAYPKVLEAKAAAAPAGRGVLLACPPQEAHELGLRMLADRFEMAGWTAYFLGADTPPEELADAARALGVDAVALSSSTHFHRLGLRHLVDELKERLPGVAVWVGGAAFARDRQGWADDELLDVDALLGDGTPGDGARRLDDAAPAGGSRRPGAADPAAESGGETG